MATLLSATALDANFASTTLEIEAQRQKFSKHERIRIDAWLRKLR
jgi:hypothetical protein